MAYPTLAHDAEHRRNLAVLWRICHKKSGAPDPAFTPERGR